MWKYLLASIPFLHSVDFYFFSIRIVVNSGRKIVDGIVLATIKAIKSMGLLLKLRRYAVSESGLRTPLSAIPRVPFHFSIDLFIRDYHFFSISSFFLVFPPRSSS